MQRTYTTKPVTFDSEGVVVTVDPITVRVNGEFDLNNKQKVVNLINTLIADSVRDVVTNISNKPVDGSDVDPLPVRDFWSPIREVDHTYHRLANALASRRENHLAHKLMEISNMLDTALALVMIHDDQDDAVRQLIGDIRDKVERITY